jgi:hypothetical protein
MIQAREKRKEIFSDQKSWIAHSSGGLFFLQPKAFALIATVFLLVMPTFSFSLPLSSSAAHPSNVAGPAITYKESKISLVSRACDSLGNAEVEQAVDHQYVYELWMGCNGIGFARSTDGGIRFDPAISLPDTGGRANSWDPALAVSPKGVVYAAFMLFWNGFSFPVVEASFNHGRTFSQVSFLIPPKHKNWGDRDFIAVAPSGRIYVTWDYGPSAKYIKYICSKGGSCAFLAGDLNAVIQWSSDGGRTWSNIVPINPNFPAGGGDSAPMVVEPSGRIDVLYQGYKVTNPKNYSLAPAHSYFAYSTDGGQKWSSPILIGPKNLTMSLAEWWIDGSIARDSTGNLYATWDTQQGNVADIGWLSYSTNGGRTWSNLVRMTPDHDHSAHILEVTGGGAGIAYVGWLSNSSSRGWAQYLSVFSIKKGVLTPVITVSRLYGAPNVWPGDTFGISTITENSIGVSWGSAIALDGHTRSQIFAARLSFTF